MRAKVEHVFDFGGENFTVSQVDIDIWNVHDSHGQLFGEFDAPPSDMCTEDKVRAETLISLTVDGLLCCLCQTRNDDGEGYDGLCGDCADVAEANGEWDEEDE